MPNYVYKKPDPKDEEFPERIRRKIELGNQISAPYVLSDDDKRLIEFEKYKETFAESLVTFIASLRKIRFDNKDWLVYKLIETIKDKENKPHTIETWHGFHTEPEATTTTNQFNEVTEVVVEKERIVYDLPFSRKAVDQVLNTDNVSNTPSDIAIGVGEQFGIDTADPTRLPLLSVFSLEEFVQFKYEYLEGANKDGSLVPSYGGMVNYLDKMGISYEEAMYEGEKIPEAFLPQHSSFSLNQNQSSKSYSPSIQEQEQNISKAKYKQVEARQKSQG